MIDARKHDDGVTFPVRVQPRSSRESIEGEWQGALRVRLNAPPVDDRANEALRRLLASRLNLPLTAVRILSGERSRIKRVHVRGASERQIRELAESQ
jgi:uncharacterized protein